MSVADQVVNNSADDIHRYGKADPLGLLCDRRVDADQPAIDIEQRAT
jgi:hypothetical protein